MNAHDFTYWLQGFAELQSDPPTAEQWQAIKDHLALVFNKVTPQRGPGLAGWPPRQIGQPYIGSPLIPAIQQPNTGTPIPERVTCTC